MQLPDWLASRPRDLASATTSVTPLPPGVFSWDYNAGSGDALLPVLALDEKGVRPPEPERLGLTAKLAAERWEARQYLRQALATETSVGKFFKGYRGQGGIYARWFLRPFPMFAPTTTLGAEHEARVRESYLKQFRKTLADFERYDAPAGAKEAMPPALLVTLVHAQLTQHLKPEEVWHPAVRAVQRSNAKGAEDTENYGFRMLHLRTRRMGELLQAGDVAAAQRCAMEVVPWALR